MRGDVTDDDSRADLCTLRMEEGARGQKMQMASTFWSRKEMHSPLDSPEGM